MEYWIVNMTDPVKLSKEVHRLIKEGWKPQGGVSASDHILYQAMIRGDKTPVKTD